MKRNLIILVVLALVVPAWAQEAKEWSPFWPGKRLDESVFTDGDQKSRLAEHEKWLRTKGKEGKPLELVKADLFGANLSGANFSMANFSGANLSMANLSDANLSDANLSDANLSMANFVKANLFRAKLSGANLFGANLLGAILLGADLSGANLNMSNLSEAALSMSNLSMSNLSRANLSGADLSGADLSGAMFTDANLDGMRFESVKGLPEKGKLDGIQHIDTIRYASKDGYGSLVLLRTALKDVGLRDAERQATYAIEYGKLTHMLWAGDGTFTLSNCWTVVTTGFERTFRTVLFLWPCGFGLYPGRPLLLLLGFIPVFALGYLLAILRPMGESGIYRLWPGERLPAYVGANHPQRLHATGWAAIGWALYFSILSACRIGWRELNPGSWIVNMQRQEYLLKPTGWMRTVAGLQALISVYMLALSVLTYFGRPFE